MKCEKCGSTETITKLQTVHVDGGWLGLFQFDRFRCQQCGNVWVVKINSENERSELKIVRSKRKRKPKNDNA